MRPGTCRRSPPIPPLLEQVVVNLLNNAIHAVLEKHGSMGGEIRVAAASENDGQVTVSVTDNGTGISPGNMEKIFSSVLHHQAGGPGHRPRPAHLLRNHYRDGRADGCFERTGGRVDLCPASEGGLIEKSKNGGDRRPPYE